jgi:hypothetical protein
MKIILSFLLFLISKYDASNNQINEAKKANWRENFEGLGSKARCPPKETERILPKKIARRARKQ